MVGVEKHECLGKHKYGQANVAVTQKVEFDLNSSRENTYAFLLEGSTIYTCSSDLRDFIQDF